MDELLAELYFLIYNELVNVTDPQLKSIHIMDTFTMETQLRQNHLPALVVTPLRDRHEQGPFANTARIYYDLRLRIVARSFDYRAYMTENNNVTNVYQMSENIRQILYKNKKLTSNTFEMMPRYESRDVNVIYNDKSGQFSGRDILLSYTALEGYTGMQNKQSSLDESALFNI